MGITHLSGLEVAGVPTMGMNGIPLTNGNVFFCDYANGSDGNSGSADSPFKTVYWGYQKCVAGNGDVVVVINNGATTSTQRLSLANAQAALSTATTGTLTWAKNATHLVGAGAPSANPRARFAPPTGTYTQTTFNSGNFINVTASGCVFANLAVFNGFSTGGTAQIAWTEGGGRNYYNNVALFGCEDATSAADTGSMSLLIKGTGENIFDRCIIGSDTTARTVANASLQLQSGTARNIMNDCTFMMLTTSASSTFITIPSNGMDRTLQLNGCRFLNAVDSTSTTLNAAITNAGGSPGGAVILDPNCLSYGATAIATTGAVYGVGAVPVATTSSIAIHLT